MKPINKLIALSILTPNIGHAQIVSLEYGHENTSRLNDLSETYRSSGTADWYETKLYYGNNLFFPVTFIEYDHTASYLQNHVYTAIGLGYSFSIDSRQSFVFSASYAQESTTYSDHSKDQREFYLAGIEYHFAHRTMDYFQYRKMEFFYRNDFTQDQGRDIYSQSIGLIWSPPIIIPDIGIGFRYGTKDAKLLDSTPDIQTYGAFLQVSF